MTTIAQTYRLNALFAYGLFALAALSIVAYVCLTVATIFATSHKTAASVQSAVLTSQIGELEQSYLLLQGRVNPMQASVLGLVQPSKVTTVSAGSLSIRN